MHACSAFIDPIDLATRSEREVMKFKPTFLNLLSLKEFDNECDETQNCCGNVFKKNGKFPFKFCKY